MMEDKTYQALLKKSNRKKTRRSAVTTILTVLVLLMLGGGGYLWYFNEGPFTGYKVSGVPNNSMRNLNVGENSSLSLLLPYHGSYSFNAYGYKIAVKYDYYEKGKVVKTDTLTQIEAGEKINNQMSGYLNWGVTEENDRLKTLMVSLNASGVGSKGKLDLSQFDLEKDPGGGIAWNQASYDHEKPILKYVSDITYGRKYWFFVISPDGVFPTEINRLQEMPDISRFFVVYFEFLKS